MASKLKVSDIANQDGSLEVPVETVIAGSAKAWVKFNGAGVVSIFDSFNVSSITDNGTGDYTVNYTNAMNDANYSMGGTTGSTNNRCTVAMKTSGDYLAGSTRIVTIEPQASTFTDNDIVTFQVFAN